VSAARRDSAPALTLTVDARPVRAPGGVSVAAALLSAGVSAFRHSVSGEARAPLCGMGVCYECRVTIDGVPHRRACLVPVAEGMVVRTGAPA
jgi:predicted molibdopterin-dependent oxidoreductase YjgC